MLAINTLDIRFGDKYLFKEVSTLMKIMAGLTETDAGVLSRARSCTVGYLPQEASALVSDRTIYQEAETAFAEALALQADLDRVNRELSSTTPSAPEFAALLKEQGELQHRLERIDIYRVQAEIGRILTGLGFREADFDRSARELSGGWLMRLMLAKMLLARPSLLLLDEPTNHLDLDSLTWLEGFLSTYDGSFLIISHDRAFLDKTTNLTWELSLGRLTAYKGNYSKYVEEKEIRLQVERAAYANQQAQIKQTMRFVQRFRAKSTKAKQVQSRLRQLSKMEMLEISETEHTVDFRFPPAADCGRDVLKVEKLSKSFDGRQVFADLNFQLQRGDKLAVIGVNGAGKSTLVKILAGLETANGGFVTMGHNVLPSYFGQHQAQELSPQYTILQTVHAVSGDMPVAQVRSLLGAFLFRDDEVEKKVQVLSGGEKSRVALARMIVQPANLLILDEPTNHLDMASQDVLQEAMRQYDGTIVVVSHNRYFVNGFANKVLEIRDGAATVYEGNIDDYLYRRKILEEQAAAPPAARETANQAAAPPEKTDNRGRGKAARQEQARLRQEKNKRLAPFKKIVEAAEKEIEQFEKRKNTLEKKLADPELYRDEVAFSECSREYKSLESKLERHYYKWEEAQAEIEKIDAEFAEQT